MTTITPTNQPAHWLVKDDGSTGITRLAEVTAVSNAATPIYAEGEQAFLNALEADGTVTYPPLPGEGEFLEQGEVYDHNATLLMVRQSHTRTHHDPTTVPALFLVYQPGGGVLDWVAGEQVYIGILRNYESVTYECIQAHVTQSDWTPPNVGIIDVLWKVHVPPGGGEEWVDSGETVVALFGAGVIQVTDTAPFAADQQIRIDGTNETTVSYIHTPGAPGILVIDPHVNVSGGESIEIWQ